MKNAMLLQVCKPTTEHCPARGLDFIDVGLHTPKMICVAIPIFQDVAGESTCDDEILSF